MSLPVLYHPVAIAVSLLAVVTATYLPGGLMGNTLETLIYAKHWLDPTFIADDWRLGLHPGPRLPFVMVVGPFLKFMSVEQMNIIGAVVGYLLLTAGLGVLFARLGLSVPDAVIAIVLFILAEQSIAAGEWVFSIIEAKTFAYALIFLALALAVRNQIVPAAALLGLATTMHVLVGGWATFCFTLALLLTRRGTPRQRGLAAVAFGVGALPGIAGILTSIQAASVALPEGVTAEYVYVYLRAPHHLDPWALLHFVIATPQRQIVFLLGSCVAIAFFAVPRFLDRSDPRLFVIRFLQASLIPVVAGGIAAFVVGGERFLRYYPFRLADTLFPLLGTAVVLALVIPAVAWGRRWHVVRTALAFVALISLAIMDPGQSVRNAFERPPPGFAAAAAFVRTNAPTGQPVLVSPHIDLAGYWMERPVVALWKFVPHDKPGIAEWYHRMVDLGAITAPASPTEPPRRARGDAFTVMSTEEYLTLARKYGARYLITRRGDDIALPMVFESDPLAVYVTP